MPLTRSLAQSTPGAKGSSAIVQSTIRMASWLGHFSTCLFEKYRHAWIGHLRDSNGALGLFLASLPGLPVPPHVCLWTGMPDSVTFTKLRILGGQCGHGCGKMPTMVAS